MEAKDRCRQQAETVQCCRRMMYQLQVHQGDGTCSALADVSLVCCRIAMKSLLQQPTPVLPTVLNTAGDRTVVSELATSELPLSGCSSNGIIAAALEG